MYSHGLPEPYGGITACRPICNSVLTSIYAVLVDGGEQMVLER